MGLCSVGWRRWRLLQGIWTTVWCSQVTSRVSFVLFDFADAPEVYKRSKAEGFKIDQNCFQEKVIGEGETEAERGKRRDVERVDGGAI